MNSFAIPYLADITVDGNPSDWDAQGFRIDLIGTPQGTPPPTDGKVRLRLGWDKRGLLVLGEVSGDGGQESDYQFWRGHCLEFFLSGDLRHTGGFQLLVSPGIHPARDEVRWEWADSRLGSNKEALQVEVARSRTERGYILELLLPWSNLGLAPRLGDNILFKSYATIERLDALTGLLWQPEATDPRGEANMYRLRLSEGASSPFVAVIRAQEKWGPVSSVRIVAVPELTGEYAEVSLGEERLARAQLEKIEGYAQATLALPGPSTHEVAVRIGDQIEEQVNVEPTRSPRLEVHAIAKTGAHDRIQLQTRLSDNTHYEALVEMVVLDQDGRSIIDRQLSLGASLDLDLSSGLYVYHALIADLFGNQLFKVGGFICNGEIEAFMPQVLARSRQVRNDPAWAAYSGLLDHQAMRLERWLTAKVPANPVIEACFFSLAAWTTFLTRRLDLMQQMRGVVEWAFLSRMDGRGQRFELFIPPDYDPKNSYPLVIVLQSGLDLVDESCFYLYPKIRPNYPYEYLGHTDILDALDYLQHHWTIDMDRVHLSGLSMGGSSALSLAVRHPDRFASITPLAGGGAWLPVENLLNLPLLALHGGDDFNVALAAIDLPLRRLRQVGGQAELETVWGYGPFNPKLYQ